MASKFNAQAINVMIQSGLTPLARSMALATAARQGVEDLITSGRATPKYRRFVDGIEGIPEDAVSPEGTILYRFQYLPEVVVFAIEFLKLRSPIKSGNFRSGFMVSIDNIPQEADKFNPETSADSDRVLIYNKLPYSRKIDVQLIGGRKLSFSQPAGLFDDAVTAVTRQFRGLVVCKRLYTIRHPDEQYTRKKRRIEYPTLEIRLR